MEARRPFAKPLDLSHHLSRNAKSREPAAMKSFYKYFAIPSIGQLAGGLPNDKYFPYDNLEAKVALPDRWQPTPNDPVDPPSTQLQSTNLSEVHPSSRIVIPHTSKGPDVLRRIDLATALQYGTAQGYPPLYQFVRQFTTQNLHPHVPYEGGPEVILSCGNTDGFSKALQAFFNEWTAGRDPVEEREGLLCENFCYGNAIQGAKPRGCNIIPVGIDDEGMRAYGPGGLQDVLENWDFSRGKRPHLIYTVTIGQNPTSGVLSIERRKQIYELAVQYDIIIVEDDPYWYLQYPSSSPNARQFQHVGTKSSGFEFLDSLVPSYLSMDYQGRVVRLDTFSKTVAPGCRLGWITAQPALIERFLRLTEGSTQQPSGFVQSMISELIVGPQGKHDGGSGGLKNGQGWDVSGWVRWLEGLRGNYERRMNTMCDILDAGKQLVKAGRRGSLTDLMRSTTHPWASNGGIDDFDADADDWAVVETTNIYDFDRPLGGMFVWVRVNIESHPLAKRVDNQALTRALWIFWTTDPYKVLVSPGAIFSPTDEIRDREGYKCFRLCFAACEEADIAPFSKRFVQGARDFWRIKNAAKIEELLEEDDKSNAEGLSVRDMSSLASFGFC